MRRPSSASIRLRPGCLEKHALGPQFAIFSSLTSLRRSNFANRVIFSNIPAAPPNRPTGTVPFDLSPWDPLASNPDQLIEAINQLLLHGAMSAEMRDSVKVAVESIPYVQRALARLDRALSGRYLVAVSGTALREKETINGNHTQRISMPVLGCVWRCNVGL